MSESGLVTTNATPDLVLWLDMEMSSPDDAGTPLHIAAVVGDFALKEVAFYEAVFDYTWSDIQDDIAANYDFWGENLDVLERYRKLAGTGVASSVIDSALSTFIDTHFAEPTIIAGNSIYEDRKWIKNHLPAVESRLDRRMVDVSSLKIAARAMWGTKYEKVQTHDPISDIRETRQELLAIMEFAKSLGRST